MGRIASFVRDAPVKPAFGCDLRSAEPGKPHHVQDGPGRTWPWPLRLSSNPKWLCKRVLNPGNWFQAIYLICFRAVHCMPKIPILLQTQPEIGGHAQDPSQPQRRVRSHRTSAFNDFVEPRIRNLQATSQLLIVQFNDRPCRAAHAG